LNLTPKSSQKTPKFEENACFLGKNPKGRLKTLTFGLEYKVFRLGVSMLAVGTAAVSGWEKWLCVEEKIKYNASHCVCLRLPLLPFVPAQAGSRCRISYCVY